MPAGPTGGTDRVAATAMRTPFRAKSPFRWRLAVRMFAQSPMLWAHAETFAEAVEIAKGIEWGFETADGGEPGLSRTMDLDSKTERELGEWLDRLSILEEGEGASRGDVSFSLGTGYFTKPSGKQEGSPMELEIRLLTKAERRKIAQAG